MRLGTALLLVCGACDAFQPNPPSGDAGVHQAPISLDTTNVGVSPEAITLDFSGNVVAAQQTQPSLTVLDSMNLAVDSTVPVPGVPDPWATPQLEAGAEGEGYLFVPPGAFFFVDMTDEAVTPIADAGRIATWVARLDSAGVAYADLDGGVHVLSADGGEVRAIAPGGDIVESLAVTLNGTVLMLTSTDGGCNTIRSDPTVSGAPLSGWFGTPPCQLALASQAGAWLWVMGQVDGGAQVQGLRSLDLSVSTPATAVAGISPTQLVVSPDGVVAALLGAGPTNVIAIAQTANITSLTSPGQQGPWQLATTAELTEATSGVFDDSDNLYVADPGTQSVAIIQQVQ